MKKLMYSSAGLLLIALAFLAFNMVSGLALTNARLDLTEQKLYTISDGTRQILGELDEPINLYFFYSDKSAKDLVVLRNYARRVEEMLKAYAQAADGKIKLHIVDPEPFSEDEDKAAEFGLQAVPAQQGGDAIYFGLAGTNSVDDHQVIPFFPLDQEEFLEYEVSRLVQSLAHPQRPVVGVLSGLPLNGGFDMQTQQPSSPWMVMEEIRQLFQIESLKPDVDQIPDKVSVLLLVHPKNLPEQTQYAIDQFVLRGGKLLAFVDPWSEADHAMPMPGEMGGEGKSSDMPALFKAWGFEMLPGKVLGDGAYAMSVSMGQGERPARHPAWLTLPRQALDPSDVATANLETLTVATAGILRPLEGAKTHFVPLIHSSEYAMPFDAQRFAMLRNPQELMGELNPSGDRYTVAARISGPAQSAFPDGIEGRKDGLKSADNINVIVFADTDMLSDRMWVQVQDFFGQRVPQPWADNSAFAINALDNLSGSEALISVRSRGRFTRPFTVVEDLQRQAEARFREQEQALKQRLSETEEKLASLQNQDPAKALELTPEQQATLQQFMQEKLRIRKELREVNYQLNADIEKLGRTLKFINIALVPLVLTLGVLLLWAWRRRRA
ncbi:Gldg family protein [Pseudomonas otitidis]|uniref:Gldg family protein n=1 Tax=Metapseudomonas otitidis TaxID=319939 RepID=A0ABU3XZC2_9GAMM|nr:Gldg family protein [Pseudomonas otitidis]MDH1106466.1 Gldg family protein [Pseudomonas otitidis]MDH1161740.1 Gldg family protein [Pseudomonas otitidis]MDH1162650.1 Gldg family protein [Pseudomonas otitidis]MDV3443061.1 Gldg family protein [Pseudomonas otitidis]